MLNISSEMTLWRLFLSGGPLMWPILMCSFFSMSIVIHKFRYFYRIAVDVNLLRDQLFEALKRYDVKEAMAICDRHSSPMTEVLKAGLLKLECPRDELTEELQGAAQFAVAGLEERLEILSAIGQISPLLGFLGTVSGMTVTFYTIHIRAAAMNPVTSTDIAAGIWQALITSVAGFVVAIPTLIAYRYFIARRNRYVLQMERMGMELVNFSDHLRSNISKG